MRCACGGSGERLASSPAACKPAGGGNARARQVKGFGVQAYLNTSAALDSVPSTSSSGDLAVKRWTHAGLEPLQRVSPCSPPHYPAAVVVKAAGSLPSTRGLRRLHATAMCPARPPARDRFAMQAPQPGSHMWVMVP
jgi:hypothetical protein